MLMAEARIKEIDGHRIQDDLNAGRVVVVAGFQGADEQGNITTLGRGGSDTTAVALAAALEADECQIYTDVDGVYTTDQELSRMLADWIKLPSKKCLRWPVKAQKFCKFAQLSLQVNTMYRCVLCPVLRRAQAR